MQHWLNGSRHHATCFRAPVSLKGIGHLRHGKEGRTRQAVQAAGRDSYTSQEGGRPRDQQVNSSEHEGQYFGSSPSQSKSSVSYQQAHRAHPTDSNNLATQVGSKAAVAGIAVLGLTFVIAVFRQVGKFRSPRATRQRTMNKNKMVVETLNDYLPTRRPQLTPRVTKGLQLKTGFNGGELFRKYLWYLLRERKFDQEAVNDIVYLKSVLNLNEDQTAEALRERASRIYDAYGNIMLNTQGMTAAGIERKATARALFSKMLYLSEYEELLTPYTPAAEKASMRDVFGATEEDVNRLRIVSLQEVDLDKLEGQFDAED